MSEQTARQMANAPRNNRNRQQTPPPTVDTSASTVNELLTDEPTSDEPTAPLKRRSVLEYLTSTYPVESISFKMAVREPNAPWKDGTISQNIAEAVINVHDPVTGLPTGLEIRSVRIAKRTKLGKTVLDLQMPSTGTSFRQPVFDTDEQQAKDGFNRWRKLAVDAFYAWRTADVAAAKANGHDAQAAVTISDSARPADEASLKELGL
jgi:hypothetical protein